MGKLLKMKFKYLVKTVTQQKLVHKVFKFLKFLIVFNFLTGGGTDNLFSFNFDTVISQPIHQFFLLKEV